LVTGAADTAGVGPLAIAEAVVVPLVLASGERRGLVGRGGAEEGAGGGDLSMNYFAWYSMTPLNRRVSAVSTSDKLKDQTSKTPP
jgi:hypothetical protein